MTSSDGAINPATTVQVDSGKVTSFTISPNAGYTASVSGTCGGTLSGNAYTTKAITANCTVVATFSRASVFYETKQVPTGQISPDTFLALLNQEGAKGFYFYQDHYNYNDFGWTFVNDGSEKTYSYDLLPYQLNLADFMTQVNAEGANGYLFDMVLLGSFLISPPSGTQPIVWSVYHKDNGSSAKYQYTTAPIPANAADLLAQLNTMGKGGYWLSLYGVPLQELYVRDDTSKATYTYTAPAAPLTVSDFLAQLNSEGAKGYRALYLNANYGGVVYLKDETQLATFSYQADTTSPTIAKINNYGMQDYVYLGWFALGFYSYDPVTDGFEYVVGPTAGYYVTSSNCSGWLCSAVSRVIGGMGASISIPLSPSGGTAN